MAGFQEYEDYDAVGLAELVARGDITPEALLEAAIERVEARNGCWSTPTPNASCIVTYDREAHQIPAQVDGLRPCRRPLPASLEPRNCLPRAWGKSP